MTTHRPVFRVLIGHLPIYAAVFALVLVFGVSAMAANAGAEVSAEEGSGSCPNELRREEQNALYLPECRAYEMVSPLDKNGSDITGNGQVTEAAGNGEAVAYGALAGFSETSGSGGFGYTQYVARREAAAGWHSRGITPRASLEAFQFVYGAVVTTAFSRDLSAATIEGYQLENVPGGLPKAVNLYKEHTAAGGLETISEPSTPGPFGLLGIPGAQRGASADLNVVTLETESNLVPEATGFNNKLYVWSNGKLGLAGILPDGTVPSGGSEAPASQASFAGTLLDQGTVSTDGSRIAFASPAEGPSQLYLRRDQTSTAWVSQSEASSPIAEPHGVRFQAMTPDGHRVVFTSGDPLLDSDPGGEGVGLYIYTDGHSPATEPNLTFLARLNASSSQQLVSAISDDAKRIYFYTEAGGQFAERGTYVWDEGAIHLVAATQQALASQSGPGYAPQRIEASSDGGVFAFLSKERLTAEAKAATGSASQELMYVYDESTQALRCASCTGAGTPTTSSAQIEPAATREPAAISLPLRARFVSSDGGHVFFATADPLVAQDTNGLDDVYEYDPASGSVSLLSSGTGGYGAWFAASDESGDNVFILTRGQLVSGDTDSLVDLYDVRAGGGFVQSQPQIGGCVGDECQGTPSSAPTFNTASGFAGLGNVAREEGKVGGTSKPRALTRAQKLARALKACKRKPTKAHRRCSAQARRRYGPHKAKHATKARKLTSRRVGR